MKWNIITSGFLTVCYRKSTHAMGHWRPHWLPLNRRFDHFAKGGTILRHSNGKHATGWRIHYTYIYISIDIYIYTYRYIYMYINHSYNYTNYTCTKMIVHLHVHTYTSTYLHIDLQYCIGHVDSTADRQAGGTESCEQLPKQRCLVDRSGSRLSEVVTLYWRCCSIFDVKTGDRDWVYICFFWRTPPIIKSSYHHL